MSAVAGASNLIVRTVMKFQNTRLFKYLRNGGGGGGKAPAPAAPAAPPPPPPPVEDTGPDPAMQAELEKQRALRFKAGELGSSSDTTGSGTQLNTEQQKTLLGE